MRNKHATFLLFFTLLQSILSTLAIDFVFNGFNSSHISLYGSATIESRIITLTKDFTHSVGRALYPSKIQTRTPNSSYVLPFSTSFIFSIIPYKGKTQVFSSPGLQFLFVPHTGLSSKPILGSFDDYMFEISFVSYSGALYQVNVDGVSLNSVTRGEAGYWPDDEKKPFKKLKLDSGKNFQVWIDYADSHINVTMMIAGKERPKKPLITATRNLSRVLEDEMYVGFSASSSSSVQRHNILAWSYSNDDLNLRKKLITSNLPSFELPKDGPFNSKWFVAGMTVGIFCIVVIVSLLFVKRYYGLKREREGIEDWELEYWPHKFSCQEIERATNNFSNENVIGIGSNGKVYKGLLSGGVEVAVKRISLESGEGKREFESEISCLGRLKHKNLVELRGWCKKKRGSLILIYDYMENGSLEKMVFECDGGEILSCKERIKILNNVASAVLYLHEGWESIVLHRDIKSSNVLLDKDMNARLGDFGLARIHDHNVMSATSRVVGTPGYMAPEVVSTGRASCQTDVYSYGVLILEVLCGRRSIEEGKPLITDYIFELLRRGRLGDAVDTRLRARGEIDEDKVSNLLHLGLLCTHPDPSCRPTIRQIVELFEGNVEIKGSNREDMRRYILEKIEYKMFSSINSLNFSNVSQPTFEELKDGLPSSMSHSWFMTNVVGR